MTKRVVITECAAITPIGHGKKNIVNNLKQGVSGVRKLRRVDQLFDHLACHVFGTVDYPIEYDFARHDRKTMGPVAYYACQASKEIFEKAGLTTEFITSGRLGISYGSTHGSPSVMRRVFNCLDNGSSTAMAAIGAVDYLKCMVHTTAVNIAKMFGITGRILSPSSACTTSSQSIGYAYEMVKFGIQDAMLCGGADEYDTTSVAVFDNLLACSAKYNDTPAMTPRPFDENRDGLVVSEGAGALLLEEYEFAKKRGAHILGEIVGYACNNNGGDLILPNIDGITNTMKLGLKDADISPEKIDFVSAHATATKMGDVIEAQAIDRVYGKRPFVTGLKGAIGHAMGACGSIETIFTLYMMNDGFIVPTLNLEKVDKRCAMLNHTPELMDARMDYAAINNFAFGGVNTCIILKKVP